MPEASSHSVVDRMSVAARGSASGYAPTRIVNAVFAGSVRSTTAAVATGAGTAANGEAARTTPEYRSYRNAVTPTAVAHANSTIAALATSCARRANQFHRDGCGAAV